jgi:bifunctional non-homologous end joining protein LigD
VLPEPTTATGSTGTRPSTPPRSSIATLATMAKATFQDPMLATLVKPTSHYDTQVSWQYERKLDGLRCVAVRNGDQVDLWSRNQLSFNARFPSVVAALTSLQADNFVLDGELVAFDALGETSFGLLQGGHPGAITYCVFDLLTLLGRDTTGLPLAERQSLMVALVDGAPAALQPVRPLVGSPADLLAQACAAGWEGLVAKRVGSVYRAGRSPDWQKLKCTASQELVIGGWTEPQRSRVGFGAILVGYYDDDGSLRYAGKVGTGFSDALLRSLHAQLLALEVAESPFSEVVREKGAHWARPELVGAVNFTEWTTDGRLRHPAFQGLRPDKAASDVRREVPAVG